MELLDVRLTTSRATAGDLRAFYAGRLGFETVEPAPEDLFGVRAGATTLRFGAAPTGAEPFYHFALLAPGDRFDPAREWLERHVPLLEDPGGGGAVFDFADWDARACYFLDPAGSIVELIAHRGVAETGRAGAFDAREIAGFSELGLVTADKEAAAARLAAAGLRVWAGDATDPNRIAFVGERARTLILSPPGRGWLPTGRPAEAHAVDVVIAGEAPGLVDLDGGQRVRVVSAESAGAGEERTASPPAPS